MEHKEGKRILVYGMSDNPGGMESYILHRMRHMDSNECHFDMLTVFPEVAYRDELLAMGSRIYYVESFAAHPVKHIKRVCEIMRGYDALYMNILDAGAFGTALAAKLAGKKVAVHSHNSDTDRPLLHKIGRPVLNLLSNERYACSEIAGTHMFGGRSFQVLENEIDRGKFAFNPEARNRMRQLLGLEDQYVVCHVGRMVRQKNPYGVLDLFSGLKEKQKDAVLLYVGDGDMKDELQDYIEKTFDQELKKAVKLLGVREDVPDLLSASDVFILPSLYEGNPISAIEAQENGLPCLIADTIELRPVGKETYKININETEQWVEKLMEVRRVRYSSLTGRGRG